MSSPKNSGDLSQLRQDAIRSRRRRTIGRHTILIIWGLIIMFPIYWMVHVITIKPGFVDTPMTAHIPKGALWAQPEDVAKDIMSAFEKDKNIVYTPWFWRYIMLIIQHVPEFIFKKLKL